MLQFWLGYWMENRSVLLDGELRAVGPALNYPMVSGRLEGKLIAAVYQDMFVPSGAESLTAIDIVNGKPTAGVVLRLEQDFGPVEIRILDTLGQTVSRQQKNLGTGAHAFDVPPSGLLQIQRL